VWGWKVQSGRRNEHARASLSLARTAIPIGFHCPATAKRCRQSGGLEWMPSLRS
jgi:hypothetical protein